MDFEIEDNTFFLFKATERKTEKHPHYRGNGKVSGQPCSVAGWVRDGKKGKYLFIKIESKSASPTKSTSTGSVEDMSDDIPF